MRGEGAAVSNAAHSHSHYIDLLSLNVCGLKSKLQVKEFVSMLKNYDVICMCETRCDDADMNNVRDKMEELGFNIVFKNRYALSRFKSGGLIIALNREVDFKWKPTKSNYETLLSVRVTGRSVGLDKDLVITCVYIPPSHSRYAETEHFDELDNLLLTYTNDDYYHVLCGDFNADTGSMADVNQESGDIDDHQMQLQEVYADLDALGLPVARFNQDLTHDRSSYGKKLIEICKNHHILIFNGRVGDDCGVGKVTITYNTTIDYVIGSQNLIKNVTQFKILDFNPLYSDVHCGLLTRVKFTGASQASKVSQNIEGEPCVRPARWRVEKESEYVNRVDVSGVNELIARVHQLSVDDISKELKDVLIKPIKEVFPQLTRKYVKQSNNACMKGYDSRCWKSRKEYHRAKCKYNRLRNHSTYNIMIEKSRKYKREIKRVKNKETINVVKQLRENKDKDPKSYWKILKGNKKNNEIPIELDKLYEHFKALSSENENEVGQENIECETNVCDSSPILNRPITDDEVKKCISKLKNNKSAGIDGILNEHIKSTQDIMNPLYVLLFNKILDTGVFPAEWLVGVIVPLYKNKGDVHDPNNYRGITLLSCIGKLFTSILNERLKEYSTVNHSINENQAGFRHEYSTLDHIFFN